MASNQQKLLNEKMGESISNRTKTIEIRSLIGKEGIFVRFDKKIGGERESVLRMK